MAPEAAAPEVRARMEAVLKILRDRGALIDSHCPSCQTDDWNVDFVAMEAIPLPGYGLDIPAGTRVFPGVTAAGGYIPMLTFVCTNCGFTKLYNLKVLGLAAGER